MEAMEPAGLAAGVIGLAGLFGSCPGGVERVRSYQSFERDTHILNARFVAARLRFELWRRQAGFDQGGQPIDDECIAAAVQDVVRVMESFCDASGTDQPRVPPRTFDHGSRGSAPPGATTGGQNARSRSSCWKSWYNSCTTWCLSRLYLT